MKSYTASCQCEQLMIKLEGNAKFVNACACRKCQKESGGPMQLGVFFPESALIETKGVAKTFSRISDKGNTAVKHFCPTCGTEMYWFTGAVPGCVGVNWGALENPTDFSPNWCVWTRSLPDWVKINELKCFETQPEK